MSGQGRSAVAALFGFLRALAGQGLVIALARPVPGSGPEGYRRSWRCARRLGWLLSGRADYKNRFRTPWRNFVAEKVMLACVGPGPLPAELLRVEGLSALTHGAQGDPAPLIILPHSRLSFVVEAVLEAEGRPPLLLRSRKRRDPPVTDLNSERSFIAKDSRLLIEIRRAVKRGHPVLATADFTSRRAGTLYHDYYVSAVLFDFARRAGVPLVFAVPSVAEDGGLRVVFQPCPVPPEGTGQQAAAAFVDLLETELGWPRGGVTVVASPKEVPTPARQYYKLALTETAPPRRRARALSQPSASRSR